MGARGRHLLEGFGRAGAIGRGARVRKRFAILGFLVAVGGALVMPATAAAGSAYSYRVVANFCDGGQPNIAVKMIKPEGLHPDRFVIVARAQHSATGSGGWSNEGSSTRFSKEVPSQDAKFTWTKGMHYVPPDNKWHRIKVSMKVIDGGSVVAAETTFSVAC
jgi:hypothetical protein